MTCQLKFFIYSQKVWIVISYWDGYSNFESPKPQTCESLIPTSELPNLLINFRIGNCKVKVYKVAKVNSFSRRPLTGQWHVYRCLVKVNLIVLGTNTTSDLRLIDSFERYWSAKNTLIWLAESILDHNRKKQFFI